jgi:hypothetical protein
MGVLVPLRIVTKRVSCYFDALTRFGVANNEPENGLELNQIRALADIKS